MAISLPTEPDGEQYEDLVVSALLALGYFVESNITLSQDGKDVLELDIVATPLGATESQRTLYEVKKENFSFTNTFKLYGQRLYLGIGTACLVSLRGAEKDDLPVYEAKGRELGVRMSHFAVKGGNLDSLAGATNGLDDSRRSAIIAALWFTNIARRLALGELRSECKLNRGVTCYDAARKYIFSSRASFFEKEPLGRAEALYQSYFDNPKLSAAIVGHVSAANKCDDDAIWTKARDSHEHLSIQSVMDLESLARFAIVKNALDDAFMRGDKPPPSSPWTVFGTEVSLPKHDLPQSYFQGLDKMRHHPHGAKIPYLFQVFYNILGGYIFYKMADELELLSGLTTIPSDCLCECLDFLNDYFGPFYWENKFGMVLMKGVPGIVRGGGSFVRQNVFKISDYKSKYGHAAFLLGMWHNAAYRALEPYLKSKSA